MAFLSDRYVETYKRFLPIHQRIVSCIRYLHYVKGEDRLTNEVALFLKTQTEKQKLKCVWFHVPNEHARHSKKFDPSLAKKIALGTIPGAPDIILLGESISLCVELKTANGRQSSVQKDFQQWCASVNVPYAICKSLDDVKKLLLQHGFLVS